MHTSNENQKVRPASKQITSLLADLIESTNPKHILALGKTAEDLAELWCTSRQGTEFLRINVGDLASVEQHASADLAVITDAIEQMPTKQGEQLLALLRNYGTHQIAVLVANDGAWSFNQFIALGFRKHTDLENDVATVKSNNKNQSYTLYTYNLDSYNHKRTWNNSRFWANPEMWNKARW